MELAFWNSMAMFNKNVYILQIICFTKKFTNTSLMCKDDHHCFTQIKKEQITII